MRSLVWLAVGAGQFSLPDITDFQLQNLLQRQIAVADGCINDCLQLLLAGQASISCGSAPCQRLVQELYDAIGEMREMEGRIVYEVDG